MSSHAAEAIMFFHRPEHPLPSMPPIFTQAATPSVPTIQQPAGLKLTLNGVPHVSSPNDNNGIGAVRIPLYQTTNQPSPKRHLIPSPSASAASMHRREFDNAGWAEEQEDIEMKNAGYSSPAAPRLVVADPSRGLSGSRWNPANENVRAASAGSSEVWKNPRNPA